MILLLIVVAAGACSVLASYTLWWASHRSGLWNLAAGVLLGVAIVLGAVLIGYLMMRGTYPQ